jgi:spore coat polysaccharide biosynthesis predicted glycosyltransferase SpsG
MAEADVVITSAGNTLIEAVAAGRRTIAIVTADNQAALAGALGDEGLAIVLWDTASAPNLAAAFRGVTGNAGERMGVALARRPVDAFGADRLMAAVFHLARAKKI